MPPFNKISSWVIQDNLLISNDLKKGNEFVKDTASVPQSCSSFISHLSDIKNVFKKLSSPHIVQNPLYAKGILSKDLKSVQVQASENPLVKQRKFVKPNAQKRISEIVNDLLPEKNASYQLAKTRLENTDINDTAAHDEAKQVKIAVHMVKRGLQDEALSLFFKSKASEHNSNGKTGQTMISQHEYEIFTLIFRLSSSFEDAVLLLDSLMARDAFLDFAADDKNKNKVNALFQILRVNGVNSIEDEISLLGG